MASAFDFEKTPARTIPERENRPHHLYIWIAGSVGLLLLVGLLLAYLLLWSPSARAQKLLARARFELDEGSKNKALELLNDALFLSPSDEGYLMRAEVYYLMDNMYKASQDLERVAKHSPKNKRLIELRKYIDAYNKGSDPPDLFQRIGVKP